MLAFSWRCMPTRMFSSAVMFWNRRMFWKVRPIPAATTSLGRALRRMPSRARRVVYQAGRMVATTSVMTSAMRTPAMVEDEPVVALRGGPEREGDQGDHERRDDPQDRFEPDPARPGDQGLALERHGSGGRVDDPGDDVEERRLARAVGADDADDAAGRDVQVDVADRHQAAEPLGHRACREEGLGRPAGCRRGCRSRRRCGVDRVDRLRRQVDHVDRVDRVGASGRMRSGARARRPGSLACRSFGCRAHRIARFTERDVLLGVELASPPLTREEALGSQQHHRRPGRCRTAGTGTAGSRCRSGSGR